MTRLLSILLLLLLCPATWAQTTTPVPIGRTERGQLVLPSYTHLHGEHPRLSILAATPDVRGDWITSAPGTHDLTVDDLSLEGHRVGDEYYVSDYPFQTWVDGDAAKFPPLYHVRFNANASSYGPNLRINRIPGEVVFERTHRKTGDSENFIDDINVGQIYGPLRLRCPDQLLGRLVCKGARSACISVEEPTLGGYLHGFASGVAGVQFIGNGAADGMVVYGETAPYGVIVNCNGVHLTYFRSKNCGIACGDIWRPVTISDSRIDVDNDPKPTVGYRLHAGARDSKLAGSMQVRPGSTGVELGCPYARLRLDGGGGAVFLKTVKDSPTAAPISNCRVTALISGGDVGMDLRENLGWANVFHIITKNVKTPYLLPPNADPRNKIYHNGKLVFPPEATP